MSIHEARSIEVKGKTVDEAIFNGLDQLGLSIDQVNVEILHEGSKGIFGLGKSAQVRLTEKDSPAKDAENFLNTLFEKMHVGATANATEGEDAIKINIEGDSTGILIGRRGETLDAIQQLTSYSVNRTGSRVRVQLDAENYRAKREQSLERLANKVAGKVVKYRRSVTLEPMNAYERHVIHTALQEVPGVTTYSTGVDPNRRVIVAYDREKK